MTDASVVLLRANLKQLRLPTMLAEFEQLAREASECDQTFAEYLLRLTELEVTARTADALAKRLKDAGFPTGKTLQSLISAPCPVPPNKRYWNWRGASGCGNTATFA